MTVTHDYELEALIESRRAMGIIEAPVYTKSSTNRQFDTGSQRDDDTNKPLPSHLDAYVRMRFGY